MKQENISFIKTLMMIIVVLCHSTAFFTGMWFTVVNVKVSSPELGVLSDSLSLFHVQTFTMASGFLFYYLKELKKHNTRFENIKKRAKRLLIPLFFTCLLWVIPIGYYFYRYSAKEIINNYVLMVAPSQLWFLMMLFLVYVFFEIFSDKISFSFKSFVMVYILSTSFGYALSYLNIDFFQISKAVQYILYFYLGGYIYINKSRITLKQIIIMSVMSIVLYIGYLYAGGLNTNLVYYAFLFILPIISVLDVSVIYYICTWLITKKKINVNNKIYKVLENNSFGIYLFHQQIIYITIVLFNGLVHPIIQVLLSFIISLVISLIVSILLKKNRVTKFMFGL